MPVYVIPKWGYNPYPFAIEIDTTSRGPSKDLSPFYLGPIIDPLTTVRCHNMENFWQYSKVYQPHIGPDGRPTDEYWSWRTHGMAQTRAQRYPMGKDAKPEYSLSPTNGQPIGYVQARKEIYAPRYADLVSRTKTYANLYQWFCVEGKPIVLRDFDGYDYIDMGVTLVNVINYPHKSMGHAFVIAGMLTGQLNAMINS